MADPELDAFAYGQEPDEIGPADGDPLPSWYGPESRPATGGVEPSAGDPWADRFTQALRYAIGLDDPAKADSGFEMLVRGAPPASDPYPPGAGLLGPVASGAAGGSLPLYSFPLASAADTPAGALVEEPVQPGQTAPQPTRPGASQSAPAPGDASARKQLADYRALMIQAEGRRNDVYKDSQGILTVGIGHKVFPGDGLKLGDVIDDGRVERLFSQDGLRALASAQRQATSVGITDPAFIPHLASVDFQLGSGWTQKFRKSWQDIEAGD